MGPELIDERRIELRTSGRDVTMAWLFAAIVVTLLMTVIAPLLGA